MKCTRTAMRIINPRVIRTSYLLLMFLLIVCSHFRIYLEIPSADMRKQDISSYVKRFAGLADFVNTIKPFRVGYLTDCVDNDMNTARLYITQYALAPVVVSESPEGEYVIGNFCEDNVPPDKYALHGLLMMCDYGRGVMLLTKAPAR